MVNDSRHDQMFDGLTGRGSRVEVFDSDGSDWKLHQPTFLTTMLRTRSKHIGGLTRGSVAVTRCRGDPS